MRGTSLLLCLSAAVPLSLPGPTVVASGALSPRIANYAIAVNLDTDKKLLTAHERITWHNPADVAVGDLQFHLYLNAFRGPSSTLAKESGGLFRGETLKEEDAGWVEIDSLRTAEGVNLREGLEFIQPDDTNHADRTVARVPLPRPVPPHGTIVLDLTFRSKLPRVVERSGFWNDFFFVGQWFPKLGVFEVPGQRFATRPGWNCHQYHANTEFYADFGVYDVDITLPSKFIVGSSGALVREVEHGDGTKTVSCHAEDIHDFAWSASPRFVVLTSSWHGVAIRALVQPEHLSAGARYLASLKGALQYFDDHVGPYPYPTFTIIDPPHGAEAAGGMEYPTLVTVETFKVAEPCTRFPEIVTVHEFGHNYWYGMVANNEFEEGWMDEGINQYYEMRIMDYLYGSSTSAVAAWGVNIGDTEFDRFSYTSMDNPSIAPISTPTWELPRRGGSAITYFKTATVMQTLDGLLGRAVMDSIMKTYFQRWRFRHPCRRDFVAVFNELAPALTDKRYGPDMNWFFHETLDSTGICDYELTALYSFPNEEQDSSKDRYTTVVLASRLGEVATPVEIEVTFTDGSTARQQWSGQERYTKLTFTSPTRAVNAVIDPDHRIALDVNVLNNSRVLDPSSSVVNRYFTKVLFWVQNLFQMASLF